MDPEEQVRQEKRMLVRVLWVFTAFVAGVILGVNW